LGGLPVDRCRLMKSTSVKDKASPRHLLNRGNLRDVVVLLCAGSTLVFPGNLAMIIVGGVILLIGCALHVLVKGVLIRNTILCQEGIYAIVRNPYYLSNYLIDSSFCLLSGNYYLLLLYPFLFFWAYGPTFKDEDSLLHSIYGPEFAKYAAETPQIFPSAGTFRKLGGIFAGFSRKRLTANEFKRVLRFCSIGFFILLLQDVSEEGLREMLIWTKPRDYDGVVYLILFIALAAASILIPRRMGRPAGKTET